MSQAIEGFTDGNRCPRPLDSMPTIEFQSLVELLYSSVVSGAAVLLMTIGFGGDVGDKWNA
jgi:hypothetical protein